jgi:hypothetical protein
MKDVRTTLRATLLGRGETLAGWGRRNGFNLKTVYQNLWRFAGKEARPGKGISLEIIEALERDTGMKICG